MALPLCGPLIWNNAEIFLPLRLHGSVDHVTDQFKCEIQTLLCQLFKSFGGFYLESSLFVMVCSFFGVATLGYT
jgi:hypothetical protein